MEQKKKLAKTLTGDYKFGENSKNSVIERTTNANVEGKEWIEDAEPEWREKYEKIKDLKR